MSKLKVLREQIGLAQHELANKAKVDRGYISEIENGKANPTQKILKRLAKALNCKASDLVE